MSFTIKCNNCSKRTTWDEEDGMGGENRITVDFDPINEMYIIECPRCGHEIREG